MPVTHPYRRIVVARARAVDKGGISVVGSAPLRSAQPQASELVQVSCRRCAILAGPDCASVSLFFFFVARQTGGRGTRLFVARLEEPRGEGEGGKKKEKTPDPTHSLPGSPFPCYAALGRVPDVARGRVHSVRRQPLATTADSHCVGEQVGSSFGSPGSSCTSTQHGSHDEGVVKTAARYAWPSLAPAATPCGPQMPKKKEREKGTQVGKKKQVESLSMRRVWLDVCGVAAATTRSQVQIVSTSSQQPFSTSGSTAAAAAAAAAAPHARYTLLLHSIT